MDTLSSITRPAAGALAGDEGQGLLGIGSVRRPGAGLRRAGQVAHPARRLCSPRGRAELRTGRPGQMNQTFLGEVPRHKDASVGHNCEEK